MVVFAMTVVVVVSMSTYMGKRKYDVSLPPDKLE
jgi:hypothetical protein